MDPPQEPLSNPYGMDEACRNCPDLCDTRVSIAHGYGDVGADFCFVGHRPDIWSDETGIPLLAPPSGDETKSLRWVLERLGLCDPESASDRPIVRNVFLTLLTRCRHPERPPTTDEIGNCDPFLTAELRTINPEIIVPVGQRPLEVLVEEYTSTPPSALDVRKCHGETIRGRGFELAPMIAPEDADGETLADWTERFSELMGTDYRQTKGRRDR